jgi:hypothetical protein
METSVLTLLLFHEGTQWVVQCLEYDLVTQGSDEETAIQAFEVFLMTWMLDDVEAQRGLLSTRQQAPEYYFDLAGHAEQIGPTRAFRFNEAFPEHMRGHEIGIVILRAKDYRPKRLSDEQLNVSMPFLPQNLCPKRIPKKRSKPCRNVSENDRYPSSSCCTDSCDRCTPFTTVPRWLDGVRISAMGGN